MKKIAISLICPLVSVLLMTSCLGNDGDTELSSDVALLSFSIGDLKTTHTIQKENGEDSTYTIVMSGKTVEFTIDQTQRTVYNSDSIAYGTNVTKVLVNVKADGGVCYLNSNGEMSSIEDSIDFTRPVTIRVTSYDEQFVRDYTASINVHQVDPKKTSWVQLENTNFPALESQKAFVKGDSLYVIGVDSDGVYCTVSAMLADATAWATVACSGIEGSGLSALLIDEVFYLNTDAGTYRSEDAVAWSAVEDDDEIFTLPGKGISHGVAWFCSPLRTNENIKRFIFVEKPELTDTYAKVWTKLSTEENWVEVEPKGTNVYGCPNLENLTVIQYADKMYAFGGKSAGLCKDPLEAFSACYESRDNGVTWKKNEDAFVLTEDFLGRTATCSATTDGECVWVMWSDGEVWRGRWNGIK